MKNNETGIEEELIFSDEKIYVPGISLTQKNRDTDYYIFSRVKNDFSQAWICGVASKKKFFQIATLKEAGTKTNNFTYDQSRYEVSYDKLGNLNDFIIWHNQKNKIIS